MHIHKVKWISKINWEKVFTVGFIYTIIAILVHQVEVMITSRYYMMLDAGLPSSDFFIKSVILTLVSGISLALVYYYIRDMLPKNLRERVLLFADLMIGLQFIFFSLPVYLLFNLPMGLLISWFISSFLIFVATSYVCVKIIN